MFGIYTSERYRLAWTDGRMVLGIASLTMVSFLINFIRQVNRMLGAGTLINLLLGRYLSPVEEERVFMFMDLNNSTTIAEKLGPRRFNEFQERLFFTMSRSPGSRGRVLRNLLGIQRKREMEKNRSP